MLTICSSFTDLIQQDHENEQAENRAKEAVEAGEAEVDKGFTGELYQQRKSFSADLKVSHRFDACDS